jgi:hypothetical protein
LAIRGDFKTVAGDGLLQCCIAAYILLFVTKSDKPIHTPLFAHRPQNLHISSSDFLQQQIEGKANDKKMGTVNRQVTPFISIN